MESQGGGVEASTQRAMVDDDDVFVEDAPAPSGSGGGAGSAPASSDDEGGEAKVVARNTRCSKCRKDPSTSAHLNCEARNCPKFYHLVCLEPGQEADSPWHCPACVEAEKKKAERRAAVKAAAEARKAERAAAKAAAAAAGEGGEGAAAASSGGAAASGEGAAKAATPKKKAAAGAAAAGASGAASALTNVAAYMAAYPGLPKAIAVWLVQHGRLFTKVEKEREAKEKAKEAKEKEAKEKEAKEAGGAAASAPAPAPAAGAGQPRQLAVLRMALDAGDTDRFNAMVAAAIPLAKEAANLTFSIPGARLPGGAPAEGAGLLELFPEEGDGAPAPKGGKGKGKAEAAAAAAAAEEGGGEGTKAKRRPTGTRLRIELPPKTVVPAAIQVPGYTAKTGALKVAEAGSAGAAAQPAGHAPGLLGVDAKTLAAVGLIYKDFPEPTPPLARVPLADGTLLPALPEGAPTAGPALDLLPLRMDASLMLTRGSNPFALIDPAAVVAEAARRAGLVLPVDDTELRREPEWWLPFTPGAQEAAAASASSSAAAAPPAPEAASSSSSSASAPSDLPKFPSSTRRLFGLEALPNADDVFADLLQAWDFVHNFSSGDACLGHPLLHLAPAACGDVMLADSLTGAAAVLQGAGVKPASTPAVAAPAADTEADGDIVMVSPAATTSTSDDAAAVLALLPPAPSPAAVPAPAPTPLSLATLPGFIACVTSDSFEAYRLLSRVHIALLKVLLTDRDKVFDRDGESHAAGGGGAGAAGSDSEGEGAASDGEGGEGGEGSGSGAYHGRQERARRATLARVYENAMTDREWDLEATINQLTPATWVEVLRRLFTFGPLSAQLSSLVTDECLAAVARLGAGDYASLSTDYRAAILRALVDAVCTTHAYSRLLHRLRKGREETMRRYLRDDADEEAALAERVAAIKTKAAEAEAAALAALNLTPGTELYAVAGVGGSDSSGGAGGGGGKRGRGKKGAKTEGAAAEGASAPEPAPAPEAASAASSGDDAALAFAKGISLRRQQVWSSMKAAILAKDAAALRAAITTARNDVELGFESRRGSNKTRDPELAVALIKLDRFEAEAEIERRTVEARRRQERAARSLVTSLEKFRLTATCLGSDRFHRTYWHFPADAGRVWVETPLRRPMSMPAQRALLKLREAAVARAMELLQAQGGADEGVAASASASSGGAAAQDGRASPMLDDEAAGGAGDAGAAAAATEGGGAAAAKAGKARGGAVRKAKLAAMNSDLKAWIAAELPAAAGLALPLLEAQDEANEVLMWSFYDAAEDLDALLAVLDTRGAREKALKTSLTNLGRGLRKVLGSRAAREAATTAKSVAEEQAAAAAETAAAAAAAGLALPGASGWSTGAARERRTTAAATAARIQDTFAALKSRRANRAAAAAADDSTSDEDEGGGDAAATAVLRDAGAPAWSGSLAPLTALPAPAVSLAALKLQLLAWLGRLVAEAAVRASSGRRIQAFLSPAGEAGRTAWTAALAAASSVEDVAKCMLHLEAELHSLQRDDKAARVARLRAGVLPAAMLARLRSSAAKADAAGAAAGTSSGRRGGFRKRAAASSSDSSSSSSSEDEDDGSRGGDAFPLGWSDAEGVDPDAWLVSGAVAPLSSMEVPALVRRDKPLAFRGPAPRGEWQLDAALDEGVSLPADAPPEAAMHADAGEDDLWESRHHRRWWRVRLQCASSAAAAALLLLELQDVASAVNFCPAPPLLFTPAGDASSSSSSSSSEEVVSDTESEGGGRRRTRRTSSGGGGGKSGSRRRGAGSSSDSEASTGRTALAGRKRPRAVISDTETEEEGPSRGGKRGGKRGSAKGGRRSGAMRDDTDDETEEENENPSGSSEDDDANLDECDICDRGGSLICCDTCPKAYHLKCLGLRSAPKDEEWSCPACTDEKCPVCKKGPIPAGEDVICGDEGEQYGCGETFHMACVGLKELPAGDWYCEPCTTAGKAGPPSKAKKTKR